MASDHPSHGAEVEEARELLSEQPGPARRRWPQLAALAVFAASAAALCPWRGGPRPAGASLVRLDSKVTTAGPSTIGNPFGLGSNPTTTADPYDSSYCPVSGENCTAKRCCAAPGLQCYKKNSAWASCHKNCTRNKTMPGDINNDTWDCEEFGARTPEPVHVDWATGAVRGEDCRAKGFCAGADDHCYLRNKAWGSCMQECDPSARLTKNWACEQLY